MCVYFLLFKKYLHKKMAVAIDNLLSVAIFAIDNRLSVAIFAIDNQLPVAISL